ncbi:MAG: hypothetical protein ACOC7U_03280, partial [Spirochaetota bacterium]
MGEEILFISNGYGEDTVSAYLAASLQNNHPSLIIKGFPTVGEGKFYSSLGIERAGRGVLLPSEGFVRSLRDFYTDIKNGFFRKTWRMGLELRKKSHTFPYLVVTGDT